MTSNGNHLVANLMKFQLLSLIFHLANGVTFYPPVATQNHEGSVVEPLLDGHPQCPRKAMQFPAQLNAVHEVYPFKEPNLQIFMNLRIPCDGFITQWFFQTGETIIRGLHLAVFRLTGARRYTIVGESYVDNWTTDSNEVTWTLFEPYEQIHVHSGDFIGIYYDKEAVEKRSIAVRSRMIADGEDHRQGNTRLFLMTSEELQKQPTKGWLKSFFEF